MQHLSMRLFGWPRVSVDDRDIVFSRQKALALLSYLALQGGPCSRDTLAEIFYPARDRTRAYQGLRVQLSHLRKAIGDDWINSSRSAVELRLTEELFIDVVEYNRLIQLGHSADADASDRKDALQRAQRLYTADFLSGFSLPDSSQYEQWQLTFAEKLRSSFTTLLRALMDLYRESGQLDRAAECALDRTRVDRTDESAAEDAMEMLLSMGKAAAALDTYRSLADSLRRELDAEPNETLQELQKRARDEATGNYHISLPALPRTPTSFIGRRSELEKLTEAVHNGGETEVTITGPAGVGKTRLAIECARRLSGEFSDGVAFIDLTQADSVETFHLLMCSSLDLQIEGGSEETRPEIIAEAIQDLQALLILDNAEHLLPDLAVHIPPLVDAGGANLIFTSRESLNLRCEIVVEVDGLDTSNERSDAVALYVDRAQDAAGFVHDPDIDQSARRMCELLDGNPLAIELAARRSRTLAPDQLFEQSRNLLEPLVGGYRDAPDRHSSMRRAIDWSYQRLDPEIRTFFDRLSVFDACFTLPMARVMQIEANDRVIEKISALVDRHLLRNSEDRTSFTMLQVIREYAREHLDESGDKDMAEDMHLTAVVHMAEEMRPLLRGPEHAAAIERLRLQVANVRSAMAYSIRKEKWDPAARIAACLADFWYDNAHFTEAAMWLKAVTEAPNDAVESRELAAIYFQLGRIERVLANRPMDKDSTIPKARGAFRRSRDLAERCGDKSQEALATALLGWNEAEETDKTRYALFERSINLARESGDAWTLAKCLNLAHASLPRTDLSEEQIAARYDESLRLAEQIGDQYLIASVMSGRGNSYRILRYLDKAEDCYLKALEISIDLRSYSQTIATVLHLITIAIWTANPDRAAELIEKWLDFAVRSRSRNIIGFYIYFAGRVALLDGEITKANWLLGAVSAFVVQDGERLKSATQWISTDEHRRMWEEGSHSTPSQAITSARQYLSTRSQGIPAHTVVDRYHVSKH